jgi:hypothetical protein
MGRFTSNEIAAISVSSALWLVLNTLIAPVFFQITRVPFLCDILAFTSLVLVIFWTRKFGSASTTGLIVAALTFVIRPASMQMLGFIAASILFDLLTKTAGYSNLFDRPYRGPPLLILFSVLCAGVAGFIIGSFFMGYNTFTPILIWTGLHAFGGLIGSIIGIVVVGALKSRKITLLMKRA